MNEVKNPKKPLAFYYCIALLIIVIFNSVVMPWFVERQVKEVDYGTFMSMIEEQNIGVVEISESENQITFTDKEQTAVYKTAMLNDPDITNRLYAAGANFSGEIIEEPNWLLSFLLTWVLPIVVFIAIGQFMSKKLMEKAGGGANSMMFNMGKSNAKVYVKSSNGIKFDDVEGVDEAEESLQEVVDYLHNPEKYTEIG